jgi:hypothetical protein
MTGGFYFGFSILDFGWAIQADWKKTGGLTGLGRLA